MTARILVVDDEPDLELLITQRFRRQVRGGEFEFVFAGDGVAALSALDAGGTFDMVLSDINMPRMDGLTLLGRLQREGGASGDRHRVRVRRHGEHPHRDEPGRVRLPDQADRLRRSRNDHRQDDAEPGNLAGLPAPPAGGRARAGATGTVFLARPGRPSLSGHGHRTGRRNAAS